MTSKLTDPTTITWTAEMLMRFRGAYKEATEAETEQFTFDGNEFVTMYAKYLIEYLEAQFMRSWEGDPNQKLEA